MTGDSMNARVDKVDAKQGVLQSTSAPTTGVVAPSSGNMTPAGLEGFKEAAFKNSHLIGTPVCVVMKDPGRCSLTTPLGPIDSLLPSLVSAVMVVVGWYVVHKAQANRERRKQIREYVTDLRDDLANLEKLVFDYHTSERDVAKEHEIISKLGRFERACSTLPRFIYSQRFLKAVPLEKLNVDAKCMQELRKAMTLQHFADEHLSAIDVHHALIQQMESTAVDMQEALERVRIEALD